MSNIEYGVGTKNAPKEVGFETYQDAREAAIDRSKRPGADRVRLTRFVYGKERGFQVFRRGRKSYTSPKWYSRYGQEQERGQEGL